MTARQLFMIIIAVAIVVGFLFGIAGIERASFSRGYDRALYQTDLYQRCTGKFPSVQWQKQARWYVNEDWDCRMVESLDKQFQKESK